MSRKSLPVVLTQAEILRLEQWVRAGSTPQQVVLRARIILAASRGQTDLRITGDLRVQRRTVALWRQRVRELGIGCVWEMRPGRGRKTRYGAAKAAAIVEATLQTKPPGSTHWSTRKLALAQGVSKNTIARVWQEHQLKPHLSKSFKLSRDPKFVEKLTDVVGVYLTPPQNAVVLCVDEKSQIQALDRTQPGLPLKPEAWHERIFAPDAPVPRHHVVILTSSQEDANLTWFHTRGLRKFGRPDLSIRDVPKSSHLAVTDLCNRLIEQQAFGGIIPEGQRIQTSSLPEGMTCHHAGGLDDPDFNNVHVEIRWPSATIG